MLIRLAKASGLPVVIQGLGGRNKVDAPTATWEASKEFLDRAAEQGAAIYSMLITRPFDRAFAVDETNLHYLRCRAGITCSTCQSTNDGHCSRTRRPGRNCVRPSRTTTVILKGHDRSTAAVALRLRRRGDQAHNQKWASRSVADIAEELGVAPADAVLDLALDEDFAIRLRWRTESPEWAEAVGEAQVDPRMVIGTSDGGAHLARDDGADWSSYFLRNWVLDRKVWTLEEGVRQITAVPAALVGLRDRGTLTPGAWADIMICDRSRSARPIRNSPTTCPAESVATRHSAAASWRRSSTASRSSSTAS